MAKILTLEVRGREGIAQTLSQLTDALNAEKILDQGGAIFLSRIRARYLEKTDPDGVPWIPSKAGLLRESKGGSGTGFDTGNLFRSIQLHARGPGVRAISTDVEYGPYFHFGTYQMVPRTFMAFSEDDKDVAERFILGRIRKLTKQK